MCTEGPSHPLKTNHWTCWKEREGRYKWRRKRARRIPRARGEASNWAGVSQMLSGAEHYRASSYSDDIGRVTPTEVATKQILALAPGKPDPSGKFILDWQYR